MHHDVGVVDGTAVRGGLVAVKDAVGDVASGGASEDGATVGRHAVVPKVGVHHISSRVLHVAVLMVNPGTSQIFGISLPNSLPTTVATLNIGPTNN